MNPFLTAKSLEFGNGGQQHDRYGVRKVEGNKISGSAIPVKIPYISRESDLLKPDNRSLLGINRTSMPASTVSRTLFRVRGTDIGKSFLKY